MFERACLRKKAVYGQDVPVLKVYQNATYEIPWKGFLDV